jgi:hypothetical protein
MAKPDEFFGQVGENPLSAAIETRRNALDEQSHALGFGGEGRATGASLDFGLTPDQNPPIFANLSEIEAVLF